MNQLDPHTDPPPEGASPHLDALALDALRAGEAPPEDLAQVETCPHCRAALDGLTALAEDLRRAVERPIAVPAEIDEAVRAQARAARVRVLRRRWVARHWRASAAAAAAIVFVLVGLWQFSDDTSRNAPMDRQREASAVVQADPDVDGSGAVDILDAFMLARRLQQPGAEVPACDLNDDGRVDDQDVDLIARLAVSLERRPG